MSLDLTVSHQLDLGMPTDIHHLGAENSYTTVHRGEGLVQLGHLPPDAGRFLDQVDLVTGVGQVESDLDAGDSPPMTSAPGVALTSASCSGCNQRALATAISTISWALRVAASTSPM